MQQSDLISWIKDDLAKAREMLERFTPSLLPPETGFDCAAICRQLIEIGGDYYDFITRPNHTAAFAIGDVSGKGISAALMLANLRAALHDEMSRETINLVGLISKLNKLVYEASPSGRFITLFYAQYDSRDSRIHYVNAGHNPPLIFRRPSRVGNPKELSVGGLPLGIMFNPRLVYQQGTETMRSGDALVAYTDGITEITDASGEEWGLNNLVKAIQTHLELPSNEIVKRVLDEIDTYSRGTLPVDDMTLIVLKALR